MSQDSEEELSRPSQLRALAGLSAAVMLLVLQGCGSVPESHRKPTPESRQKPAPSASTSAPATTPAPGLRAVAWTDLPGWTQADTDAPLRAFRAGCAASSQAARWAMLCVRATGETGPSSRAFFEQWFTPHAVTDERGDDTGLLTGYYEPVLRGNRQRTERAPHPVYGVPDDLLQVDLSALYPELAHHRLRGRVQGRKVVPYHDRAAIDAPQAPLAGRELLWVEDAVALFFLHIQGSGKVMLPDGTRVRLAYADQNGHPYKAIGKVLVERGELRREDVSLQSIRDWLLRHPDQAAEVMAQNASYVFFEEQLDSAEGPKGSQGVALTPRFSVAVDARLIDLGTPVYLDSTWPSGDPLRRLTVAQDTGGAIRGAVRVDLFLGEGDAAESAAGRMRQPLRTWVLLPRAESIE